MYDKLLQIILLNWFTELHFVFEVYERLENRDWRINIGNK